MRLFVVVWNVLAIGGLRQVGAAAVVAVLIVPFFGRILPTPERPFSAHPEETIERYQQIVVEGGWPAVPEGGPELQEGASDPRVPALRSVLIATGDLTAGTSLDEKLFDAPLRAALMRFQGRHAVPQTGILEDDTLRALNVPAAQRLRQLEANFDRWRGLPEDPGPRYLVVNIPDFSLTAVEAGRIALTMKVIVGSPRRPTPVLDVLMTEVVFHPYWNVPSSIARWELLRKIQKDPDYLRREGMDVLSGKTGRATVVDPWSVDWAGLSPQDFPFRLRQRPGPENALGRIKFSIPNRSNVYLHDTPTRSLFEKQRRTFSHGCIRLEKPEELARFVLEGYPAWTEQALLEAIQSGVHRIVRLEEPIPVYVFYWTAWSDADGTVQFREDVYHRDTAAPSLIRAADFPLADEPDFGP